MDDIAQSEPNIVSQGIERSSQEKTPHRYSVAIAIVLIAAILRMVFLQALETNNPFITFYPAVMLAALYGGLRAGALATLLAAPIADYFWIEPTGSFIVTRPADWLALAIFFVTCLLVSGSSNCCVKPNRDCGALRRNAAPNLSE